MISVNPYLVYRGNCEETFIFYKTVLGGESLYIGRYKDVPVDAKKYFPNAQDENVMHATLQIDERTIIMGNDSADISEQSAMSFSRDFSMENYISST
jgi:PhnB protein